jgi:hypothetical protein
MTQPTPGDVHVDEMLTNMSVAYVQGQGTYIADRVFPTVPVRKQSDKYRYYPRKSWFKTVAAKRAPSTETPGSGWIYSKDTYYCDVWGVHKDIDDQERANEDDDISIDADATEFVTEQLLLRRELEWKANFFTSGVWGHDLTGVTSAPTASQFLQWDQASSSPTEFVPELVLRQQQLTGKRLNTLVIGPQAEIPLTNHPDIIDRIKYVKEGFYDLDALARLLKLDRILVANAVQDTSAEMAADLAPADGPAGDDVEGDFSFVFGKDALLCYTEPNPGLRRASAGYIFTWTGLFGTGAYGGRIKQFRMEHITSDRVEGEAAWGMKVVAPDLGVFLSGVVA